MSFAALALGVVGTAVAILVLTVFGVFLAPDEFKLPVVLIGIVLMIGGMAAASNYLTNRAIRREFGADETGDEAGDEADDAADPNRSMTTD